MNGRRACACSVFASLSHVVRNALAVKIEAYSTGKAPVATVGGVDAPTHAEINGQKPLFVDAFYDVDESTATVIINMEWFLGPTSAQSQEWRYQKEWICEWNTPYYPGQPSSQRMSSVLAKVFHHETNRSREADPVIHGGEVEASENDWMRHWAVVLQCPSAGPAKDREHGTSLSIKAMSGSKVDYSHGGIQVRDAVMRGGLDYALCTGIMNYRYSQRAVLEPWVRYNRALGFQQIILYVEETDTVWVEEALSKYVADGSVTLVKFHFGKISAQKRNIMQGASEAHCLYQAKGRTSWLGHFDVDEYIQPMGKYAGHDIGFFIKDYTKDKSQPSAIVVRSQFWGVARHADPVASFPCDMTYRHNDPYLEAYRMTKQIVDPLGVVALFPHTTVDAKWYESFVVDPGTDLRVNHFRMCDHDGCDNYYLDLQGLRFDDTFKDTCKRMTQ